MPLSFALALLACSAPQKPTPAEQSAEAPAPAEALTVEDARAFYAAQPRHLQPIPWSPVPEGLPDVRASTCGGCHQEIYAEWQISTHARAWMDDPQFQAELHKPRPEDGDVTWICVNCHTPTQAQLPRLVAGIDGRLDQPIYVENPDFDPSLQLEAITCAVCHVRDGEILGPWGDTDAPHPVAKDPALTTSDVCTQCHQAWVRMDEIDLICAFNTGQEFADGPWHDRGYTCQSCHMPEVERPLMAGYPARATRRHWFGGSLLAKQPAFEPDMAVMAPHYPDGMAARWLDLPDALPAGQPVSLTLEIENAEAGHMLPTGDPERFLLVSAVAADAAGAELGRVDLRLGSVYQWYPETKLLSDDRLAPLERRALSLDFTAPAGGAVSLEVVAEKHRISQQNLEYHDLEGKIVAGRVFFEDSRSLPVQAP